jgi:hypothetical protein
MRHRHPFQRIARWLLAALIVFGQSAALAHACTIGAAPRPSVGSVPCPTHAPDEAPAASAHSGNLCEVHCQTPSLPEPGSTVAPAVAVVAMHPVAASSVDRAAPLPERPPEVRSTPPPVHLRSTRLLI